MSGESMGHLVDVYDFPAEHWGHNSHHEPDRIDLRHGALANEDACLRFARRHSGDGLQADEDPGTKLAHAERACAVGRSDCGCEVQRRTT